MTQLDRRRLLSSLVGGAALASIPGGVTRALMCPEKNRRCDSLPDRMSVEEWEIEKALLRGDYIEVASAR